VKSTLRRRLPSGLLALALLAAASTPAAALDLLQRYPTTLTAGDTSHPHPWNFSGTDIFQISRFNLKIGPGLAVQAGRSDLGIGHGADGALWAIVIPRQHADLDSSANPHVETISHVWLRFHPGQINRLFPPETVSEGGATNLLARMRSIARHKMTSSWQAGGEPLIPAPKDLTVDVDTQEGPRRFFAVDTDANTAEYVDAFQDQGLKPPAPMTPALAASAFDQLWTSFDKDYAMFALRPEVDWNALRDQFRSQAQACTSADEFAEVCAGLLRPLRDLHIWMTLAGQNVPVFDRPRAANSNPAAHVAILGSLHQQRRLTWAVTSDHIGFIAIYGWDDDATPADFQEILEHMRDTRGLILDVRLNGGGSEDLAKEVAARFVPKDFVYAYGQFRNGPRHSDLTEKRARVISPRGPWRYLRPVVLLIGQKCMSSNESFVGMMTGDPDLVTMGDHTCGSSGNPRLINLPLDMTVSVPQWIDFLPDGTPLDEKGFRPQMPFQPEAGAFEGQRDDLLTAALARLREAPLPAQPIEGPAGAGK
jgi:hypothetical protein